MRSAWTSSRPGCSSTRDELLAPRPTGRRRASRRRAARGSPRTPRPPVPPVTSAVPGSVCAMSDQPLPGRPAEHAPSTRVVRAPPYGFQGVRARAAGWQGGRPRAARALRGGPRAQRDGGEWLKLSLGDRTGSVTAVVREGAAQLRELCRPGGAVRVAGRYVVDPRHGPQLVVRSIEPAAEGTYSPADLHDGPQRSAAADGGRPARAGRHGAGPAPARAARRGCSARAARAGRPSAARRPPSTTTRPTPTGCSSTRCPSPRASARSARRSPGSTATSPSPARCCTTSASSTPTRASRARST